MTQIFKQVIEGALFSALNIGKVLHVAMQGEIICFWYIHNPAASERIFTIVGTGHDFEGTYIGTVQDGPFVWHFIEI